MKSQEKKQKNPVESKMIAPCGMNCGICIGHLRDKKPCPGCNYSDDNKPKHCVVCRIKNCKEIGFRVEKFCFHCIKFPCTRLRQLDKRYREKYRMSMIENLESIQELGLEKFLFQETIRWKCTECGKVLCVHRDVCLYCGRKWGHGEVEKSNQGTVK